MAKLTTLVGLSGIAVLAVTAYAAQAGRSFVIDGNVVSSNVLQQDGRYWVPLDDVGKYFGYFVSVNPTQANLTKIPTAPAPNQGGQANGGGSNSGGGAAPSGGSNGSPQQFVNGTGSQTNTQDPSQNKSGPQITATLGQPASVNGFDYTVTDIRDLGPQYKEVYDQRGTVLHPKYKTDSLVVVDIEETNRGTKSIQAIIPDAASISVFDGKKVGYTTSDLDIRQSSNVVKKSSSLGLDLPDDGVVDLMLGPGGTLKFAAIASVPANDPITSVVMTVSGSGDSSGPTGAVVTVNR